MYRLKNDLIKSTKEIIQINKLWFSYIYDINFMQQYENGKKKEIMSIKSKPAYNEC